MIAYLKTTNEKVRVGRLTSKGYEVWNDGRRYIPAEDLIFPPSDKKEFLTELKALMEKYNASIDWCCDECSDLAGVYDSHIEIDLNGKETIKFFHDNVDVNDVQVALDLTDCE